MKIYVVNARDCSDAEHTWREMVTVDFESAKEHFFNLVKSKEDDDAIEVWEDNDIIGWYDLDINKQLKYVKA